MQNPTLFFVGGRKGLVVCPPSKSQQVQESQLQKGVRTLYIMSSLWQKLCLNIGNSQRISQLITRKSGRRSQHDRVFNLDYPKVWPKPACIAHSNNSCFTCYIISKVCTPYWELFLFSLPRNGLRTHFQSIVVVVVVGWVATSTGNT